MKKLNFPKRRYRPMKGLSLRAEKALRKSIEEKWKPLSEGDYEGAEYQCALCSEFASKKHSEVRACLGCPVYHRSGEKDCGGTPFEDYADGFHSEEESQYLAKRELRFLQNTLRLGLKAREESKKK